MAKALLIFLKTEILCRLPLYWQVAKDSLPTAFIGRWQRALCRLSLLAGGKAIIVHEIPALPPAFHVAGGKAGISKKFWPIFYFASQI